MLILITHLIVVLYEIQQCTAKFCCHKKMSYMTVTTPNKKGHSPKHKRYVTAMLVETFLASPHLCPWLRCEILGYCIGVGYDTSIVL
jgi:Fe-S-cluster containining protein